MPKGKPKCIHCYSPELVKNGRDTNGEQRYKCRTCSKTFTSSSLANPEVKQTKRLASHLLILGYSIDEVATELGLKSRDADSWKRKYLPKLDDIQGEGKLIGIHYARNYLSALDNGKRPERISENKSAKKPSSKKSSRKKA